MMRVRDKFNNFGELFFSRSTSRAVFSIIVFTIIWQLGSKSKDWFGFATPWLGHVPAPIDVVKVWFGLLGDASYWQSWYMSFLRVLAGFFTAMVLGIPFGLLIAVSRPSYGIIFPSFEVLRPIPPLAWVPVADVELALFMRNEAGDHSCGAEDWDVGGRSGRDTHFMDLGAGDCGSFGECLPTFPTFLYQKKPL